MTGKEALRVVSELDEARIRYYANASSDATLQRVCIWWIEEREAFLELASLAGVPPPPEPDLTAKGRKGSFSEVVFTHFVSDWTTLHAVAAQTGRPRQAVSRAITKAAKVRGHALIRRKTPTGLQWRAVPMMGDA